jgi:DNA-binding transcriptional ArsR family regulator
MALEDETGTQRLASVFNALSNPRRIIILECLLEKDCAVNTLTACERLTPARQANTSQHLAVLRHAGLVTERRDGNRVIYSIPDAKHVRALLKAARGLDAARLQALTRI